MSPPPGRPKEGSLPLGGTARSAKGAPVSDDAFAPPAFKPEEALLLLKRGLRDVRGLGERGSGFEWKGQPVIALEVEGAVIAAKLAKRPATRPEWEARALKSGPDVRRFGDDVKARVARWRDADE